MDVDVFVNENGFSPFECWLTDLKDLRAISKILTALARMESGLFGDVKGVGEGVQEYRLQGKGAGYRIYYGYDGPELVILLAGGDKSNQKKDIERAKKYWFEYKSQKKTQQKLQKKLNKKEGTAQ